jgi:hypothetical protein
MRAANRNIQDPEGAEPEITCKNRRPVRICPQVKARDKQLPGKPGKRVDYMREQGLGRNRVINTVTLRSRGMAEPR